jgi:hypothetical protein
MTQGHLATRFRIHNVFTQQSSPTLLPKFGTSLCTLAIYNPTVLSLPPTPLCINNSEFHTSFLSHLVFLCSMHRLLVAASIVLSSPILVILMKEALSSSETRFL